MTANHRPLEEGDIELIDRVRSTPCLYDTKDPNFRLVYRKEQEWQSIADSLSMSDWEARKRWTVLRDRYARELKQLILHPESTEYGRNDFFLRMDFIRDFVKKRAVKRKRGYSQGVESRDEKKPRLLKMYKTDSDTNNTQSDDNQLSQQAQSYIVDDSQSSSVCKFNSDEQKKKRTLMYEIDCDATNTQPDDNKLSQQVQSYIVDDSQSSSVCKFSYDKQKSQEHIEPREQHENHDIINHQCDEQEYNDYVEDTSVAYEAVGEDHEILTQTDSENFMLSSADNRNIIKPESSKVVENFCIATEEENKLSPLPQLQQKPMISMHTESSSPSPSFDIEEYFSKTIALYLRQLSPRHKIKAKVEIMQIIEKYIDLEEPKF